MRAAHRRRVVNARVCEARLFPQLFGAPFCHLLHFILRSEMETAGRTGFDAGGLQPLAYAVGTERAFVNLLRRRVEFWNVERTARDAILAADALFLIEI